MGEFFHGWQRKIGLMTLVMTLALIGGWVRSEYNSDFMDVKRDDTIYSVNSVGGGINFGRRTELKTGWYWILSTRRLTDLYPDGIPTEITPWMEQHEFKWRLDLLGFHIGVARLSRLGIRDEDCMIPYWSIVLPLTAISAFLLLSKPHISTPKKIVKPIPIEGT